MVVCCLGDCDVAVDCGWLLGFVQKWQDIKPYFLFCGCLARKKPQNRNLDGVALDVWNPNGVAAKRLTPRLEIPSREPTSRLSRLEIFCISFMSQHIFGE